MLQRNYTTIQVELADNILRDGIYKEYAVYLLLKHMCSGKLRIADEHIHFIKDKLGYDDPLTVWKHIKTLRRLNFVGFNPKSGIFFIRGNEYLRQHYNIQSKTVCEFNLDQIKDLKAFLFSISTGHFLKARKKKAFESKKGRFQSDESSDGDLTKEHSDWNKLGVVLLAERFNTSPSTISRLKKRAQELGYLTYSHNFFKTGFYEATLKWFKQIYSEIAHKIVCRHGLIYIQQTDSFTTHHKFYSRKWM